MPSARDGNLTMRLDCSSGTWSHTADQPIPCTCPRKKIGFAADRIEACHQKFMLRRRRKTSQRFSRCSASREPLVSDPDAHGSHPTREAATSCGLSICRRLLYSSVFRLLHLATSPPRHLANPTPMCAHLEGGCAHIFAGWASSLSPRIKNVRTFYREALRTRRARAPPPRAVVCAHRLRAPAFFLSALNDAASTALR